MGWKLLNSSLSFCNYVYLRWWTNYVEIEVTNIDQLIPLMPGSERLFFFSNTFFFPCITVHCSATHSTFAFVCYFATIPTLSQTHIRYQKITICPKLPIGYLHHLILKIRTSPFHRRHLPLS